MTPNSSPSGSASACVSGAGANNIFATSASCWTTPSPPTEPIVETAQPTPPKTITGIAVDEAGKPIPAAARDAELDMRLAEVDALRAGLATRFDEVDRRCEALLSEYTKPQQHGRILFAWTQVEGQSGTQHPLKEIDLVKRALDLPQTPERRLWLFMYWGCSLEAAHRGARGNELAVARRQVVVPFLQGLAECLSDIAAVESEPEPLEPSESVKRYGLGSSGGQQYVKWARERRLDDLKRWREMFENLIASLYALQPLATTEIEALAAKMVPDKDAREQLLLRVQSEVEKHKADVERAKQKAAAQGEPAAAKSEGQPARADPALPSATKSFTAKFPSGVMVELLGVSEHPSNAQSWWRPDGSLAADRCADRPIGDRKRGSTGTKSAFPASNP
jgi:hypothetical protein